MLVNHYYIHKKVSKCSKTVQEVQSRIIVGNIINEIQN